jgi:hypothetical protein
MKRVLITSLLAVGVLIWGPTSQAAPFNDDQAAVVKNLIGDGGKISLGASKWLKLKTAIYGKKRALKSSLSGAKSIPEVIGSAPKEFGQTLFWQPEDEGLALVVFVNPADSLGIMIGGVTRGDTVEVVSASGIASFSEDTKNKGVGGFLTVVGVGAGITVSAFGHPEFVPLVNAATAFAKKQWGEEKKVKTKRRDAFGEDPSSHHKAKQEGGVLITLPAKGVIGGPFYSGTDKKYWIKEPGDRIPKLYPPHVKNAFFVTKKRKIYRATADGDLYIVAWDHIFEDNLGFYKLHIILKRGDFPDPGNVD